MKLKFEGLKQIALEDEGARSGIRIWFQTTNAPHFQVSLQPPHEHLSTLLHFPFLASAWLHATRHSSSISLCPVGMQFHESGRDFYLPVPQGRQWHLGHHGSWLYKCLPNGWTSKSPWSQTVLYSGVLRAPTAMTCLSLHQFFKLNVL